MSMRGMTREAGGKPKADAMGKVAAALGKGFDRVKSILSGGGRSFDLAGRASEIGRFCGLDHLNYSRTVEAWVRTSLLHHRRHTACWLHAPLLRASGSMVMQFSEKMTISPNSSSHLD